MALHRTGQALIEYVVLLALGSLVGVAVVTVAGPQLASAFAQVNAAIANPMELLATPTPMPTVASPPASISVLAPAAATPTPPAAPTPSPIVQATPTPTPAQHDDGQHQGQQGP